MTLAPTARTLPPALLLALALWPAAAGGEFDPRRLGWSELDLSASKLGFSVDSRLEIRRLSAVELAGALTDPAPGGWLPAPEAGGWLVHLTSEGLGRSSRLDLLLDPRGASLQRTQVEVGGGLKRYRNRTHRFSRTTVHVSTRKPTQDERQRQPDDWSQSTEVVVELPDTLAADAVLSQASGLFFTLGASDLLEPGDSAETYVLSKGRVMSVEMVVEARETLEVDHVEIAGDRARRRGGELETLRIRVSGRELGGDADADEFRFLGLRGDVRVYLDTVSRAAVLITGRLGWLGQAKVKLQRLVLAAH